MLFHTYTFLFAFLPLAWLGYYALGRFGARVAIAWLVTASLVFYGWWEPRYLALLGGSMLFNFAVGRALSGRPSRALLALGVAVNLGLIGWFKYSGLLADTLERLFDSGLDFGGVVLPLAISFFTFQQIAYLVDAHRGETSEHDFWSYALFVTFFPQLIAGPIVHHGEMLPQFRRRDRPRPSAEDLAVGLTLLALGLFKKVVLADSVSPYANRVFDGAGGGEAVGAADAWLGVGAYTFQIYFDFSGYSDMAIGLARLFGIRLPANFDSPYRATSIVEFWRRWHMTLSRFLRDYLYIPLGGGRRGRARRHANLMVTMLLGGLWHGAAWTFVVWGGLHGLFLVANHAWRALTTGANGERRFALPAWPARALTLLVVVVAWVFFRAESFEAASALLVAMAGAGPSASGLLPPGEVVAWLAALLAIAWLAPNSQQWLARFRPVLEPPRELAPEQRWSAPLAWRPTALAAALVGALLLAGLVGMHRVQEFLYFQF